jgi:hypothetical protein
MTHPLNLSGDSKAHRRSDGTDCEHEAMVGSKRRMLLLPADFIIGIAVATARRLYENINILIREKGSLFGSDPISLRVYPK